MKNKLIKSTLIAGLLFTGFSCTKLDEGPYLFDKVTGDKFGKTDLEVQSLVGAAYANLAGVGGNNHYIPLNEVTTDEIVVPTRGPDWGDGGHWVRLKRHTYVATDPLPANGWNFCYSGVSTCNRLIFNLTKIGTPSALEYIPELKALRAIYYYWLMDWYGNVPLSIDYSVTTPVGNSPRLEVYKFIESELTTNAPLLKKPTSVPDIATYGRVNYYTAEACLAKLYLNAELYGAGKQYDKAIAACDNIINSGVYNLMPNYADNFSQNDQGSKEFIWAIPFDHIKFGGLNINMMTLSYLNQRTYNINAQPWNGFASTAEFYKSYIDTVANPGTTGMVVGLSPKGDMTRGTLDKRLGNFIVGPQFAADGTRLVDDGADATDPDGPPFTFTPYMNELEPAAWRQSGARIGKWQMYNGMTSNMDNDFVIFRYADILLTKAESIARNTSNWNDATTLATVNQIRTLHGGVTPFATLTAATFLAERSREMFCEAWKRQDMIRFGTYNDAYGFHNADAPDALGPNGINHLNIFPIPDAQINANKLLKQNPGY
ncbi:RagB/SusD family nutrient uptake outer membrane protein [Ferruginibacter paludis]|uniref:RagB/SusD family nutrient uptake outer membrane protein n=1 Tax=Ferruginibacter paludis TaxID=1310417 RepID=UPI0025B568C7|nr:RagB/SusD family nutrient uptake outer membrane protein [Ferruginibacter paludis]MDN3658680.1 RagB/SusD family nutrient uptake outer membrane protein [Ferruginibacter paludis]